MWGMRKKLRTTIFVMWGTGGMAKSFKRIEPPRRSRFERGSSQGLAVFRKGNRSKLAFPHKGKFITWDHRPFMLSASVFPSSD